MSVTASFEPEGASLFSFGSFRGDPLPRLTERRLQALVYDILPSTTAVFSYVIGS